MVRRYIPPEDAAAVLALAKQGLPPHQISERMEGRVSIDRIYGLLSTARRRGDYIPVFPKSYKGMHGRRGVVVRVAVWKDAEHRALMAEAERRGLGPSELINRIVAVVLADGMISAVLDDADAA